MGGRTGEETGKKEMEKKGGCEEMEKKWGGR